MKPKNIIGKSKNSQKLPDCTENMAFVRVKFSDISPPDERRKHGCYKTAKCNSDGWEEYGHDCESKNEGHRKRSKLLCTRQLLPSSPSFQTSHDTHEIEQRRHTID